MAAHDDREFISLTPFESPEEQCNKDYKKMLPAFVTGVDRIDSVELNGSVENGRPVYEYSVSWTSSSTLTKETWDKMMNPKPKEPEMFIPCDGGCGGEYSDEDVVQFGFCDHNVCQSCLKNCPVLMFDGTPACPNKRCLGLSSRSVSCASLCSTDTQIFIVNLRILIFYMDKGHISRKQGIFEINSNTPLNVIKEKIQDYVSDLDGSEVYYTTALNFHRSNLIKIPVDEMDERPLSVLSDEDENFTFVVGCPGTNVAK